MPCDRYVGQDSDVVRRDRGHREYAARALNGYGAATNPAPAELVSCAGYPIAGSVDSAADGARVLQGYRIFGAQTEYGSAGSVRHCWSYGLDEMFAYMSAVSGGHGDLRVPKRDTGELWQRICDAYGQIDRIFSRDGPAATTRGTAAAGIGEPYTYLAPVRYRRPAV